MLSFEEIASHIERRSHVVVSLCNCISDLYEFESNDALLKEGITIAKQTLEEIKVRGETQGLLPYLYSALGVLLIKQINSQDMDCRGEIVENAINAYKELIAKSDKQMLLYPWASAKINLANLFLERYYVFESDVEKAKFNRILAIS